MHVLKKCMHGNFARYLQFIRQLKWTENWRKEWKSRRLRL